MTDEIDVEKLKAYAKLVFGALGGAMTATMIHLGDRLGLYGALADGEALTSAELAARTECAERWVREWLCQQGAAGVLEDRGGRRLALPPQGRAGLAGEAAPACRVGVFGPLPGVMGVAGRGGLGARPRARGGDPPRRRRAQRHLPRCAPRAAARRRALRADHDVRLPARHDRPRGGGSADPRRAPPRRRVARLRHQ